MYPKKKDIEAAKEYLRERVSAEVSMHDHLEEYLDEAARQLVRLAVSLNVPPTEFSFRYNYELIQGSTEIVYALIAKIQDACLTLATHKDDERESKGLYAYATRNIGGDTFEGRLDRYAATFKSEMEDFIRMGLLTGAVGVWGTKWSGFTHKGMSAYHLLDRLTQYTIADTWMHSAEIDMLRAGEAGYYVMRGSSYPCETCDEAVGFHLLSDWVLPIHAHCKCIAVPIHDITT